MTTCNRCGKTVGQNEWDIHTCTPKLGLCDDCETVSHCLNHGCTPKQESENTKAAYQRGYLDGMAKPCVKCADRQWVRLTDAQIEDCYGGEINDFARAVEAKSKELNA